MLVVDAFVERRLWMFERPWRERFESPDFYFRLALVTGAVLLILETSLFVFFFIDGTFDRSLVRTIYLRQCSLGRVTGEVCQLLSGAIQSWR